MHEYDSSLKSSERDQCKDHTDLSVDDGQCKDCSGICTSDDGEKECVGVMGKKQKKMRKEHA